MNKLDKKARSAYGPVVATTGSLFLYFAAQLLAVLLIFFFGDLVLGVDPEEVEAWLDRPLAQMLLTILISINFVAGTRLLLKLFNTKPRLIGWLKPGLRDIKVALKGFAAYIPLTLIILTLFVLLVPGVDPDQEQQIGFERDVVGINLLYVFIALVVAVPIAEEVLVRGFLFAGLRSRLTFRWSAVISSALFGVAHLQLGSGEAPLWFVGADTFVLGMVAAYLVEKTGSLWPCIFLHAMKNLVAFTVGFVVNPGG